MTCNLKFKVHRKLPINQTPNNKLASLHETIVLYNGKINHAFINKYTFE